MAKFDEKTRNDKVFQKYYSKVPSKKLNRFKKSGILKEDKEIASRLKDGVGGNYIFEPIKGSLDGKVINYDGQTDITSTSRKTFEQGKIVVGRAKGWQEKDFSTDITGEEFMPYAGIAGEVAEYFDGVDQDDILAILKGIFSMKDAVGAKFVQKHTNDITAIGNGTVGAGTLNKTITKASGDRKEIFKMVIMHSDVACDLETLQLLTYLTYTDANGIQKDLGLATRNGRLVVIDDDTPVEEVEAVEASGTKGQANYVEAQPAYNKYTTYVLGEGFIEFANCGAKVPSEMTRDAKTDGGITELICRTRKLYAPKYISFTKKSMNTLSPTPEELAKGENWEIVNDGNATSKTYIDNKFIPVARIISKVS